MTPKLKSEKLFHEGKIIIYTDGGARGNPGPAAIGAVVAGKEYGEYIGERTNNQAEYEAVIFALKKIKQLVGKKRAKETEIEIRMDSELVARQLRGEYKIREKELQPLFVGAWNLRLDFKAVDVVHIPREENRRADALANGALDKRAGVSLIEIMIVLFILLILLGATLMFFDPARFLLRSYDATRISNLQNLDGALSLYAENVPRSFVGTSSVVYMSVPDPAATGTRGTSCDGLGLPALPSGWTYRCPFPPTYQNVDGTGWIPVDFTKVPGGSPVRILPVDPRNETSTGSYYTYATGGSWELTALLEGDESASRMVNDGGPDPAVYEIGTDLTLTPFARGMIGYWNFDDASGPVKDASGWGNDATLVAGNPAYGVAGKVGKAMQFDGIDDYAEISKNWAPGNAFTVTGWFKTAAINGALISNRVGGGDYYIRTSDGKFEAFNGGCGQRPSEQLVNDGVFHFFGHIEQSPAAIYLYRDGVISRPQFSCSSQNSGTALRFGKDPQISAYYNGVLDEVRIYNRALPTAVLTEMYNAAK